MQWPGGLTVLSCRINGVTVFFSWIRLGRFSASHGWELGWEPRRRHTADTRRANLAVRIKSNVIQDWNRADGLIDIPVFNGMLTLTWVKCSTLMGWVQPTETISKWQLRKLKAANNNAPRVGLWLSSAAKQQGRLISLVLCWPFCIGFDWRVHEAVRPFYPSFSSNLGLLFSQKSQPLVHLFVPLHLMVCHNLSGREHVVCWEKHQNCTTVTIQSFISSVFAAFPRRTPFFLYDLQDIRPWSQLLIRENILC